MKKKLFSFFLCLQMLGWTDPASVFSLTADEMVFASKLTDENRRQFCYKFSAKERLLCLNQVKKDDSFSPDQIVQQVVLEDSLEKSIPR